MASKKDYILVAAIDFGTTFSGYAFSFRHDYEQDPLKISANTWTAGSGGLVSLKTSTCVLFNPQKQFHSFGFEAEDKYSNLALDNEHHDWYYFRRFKMELYNKMNIKRKFVLEDDKGKTLPAMTVFSASIRFLKDHMMQTCENMLGNVQDTDIRWVLTVPAIWNDSAKQFMTEAAENAGILSDHLIIALEPEAASLFCKYLPAQKMLSGGFAVFKPGSKYLVLDAGGGTIDITVHEVQDDGSLKEIHKANGGDWGGTKVDAAFRGFLAGIVGNDVMESFETAHKADILDLLRDFEVKKRTIKSTLEDKVTFKVPMNLNEAFKGINQKEIKDELSSKKKYEGRLTWAGDKIRMSPDLAKNLFEECSKKIVSHLQQLLRHPLVKGIDAVLMVGGFSECPILSEAVKSAFPKTRVIVPHEAGLSVLKGAVIYGHAPLTIKTRVMRHTYGLGTTEIFEEGKHLASKRFTTKHGDVRCKDIFSKHVEEGQAVDVGDFQTRHSYNVIEPDQIEIKFPIFATTSKNPKYTSDPGCIHIGKLTLSMPDTSRGLDRKAIVSMSFSGTKLEVKAKDRNTGHTQTAKFDFLG